MLLSFKEDKDMQIMVEIPDELNRKISTFVQNLNMTESTLVRMALEQFFYSYAEQSMHPYSKVKDSIGVATSGVSDLGTDHKKHLAYKMKK